MQLVCVLKWNKRDSFQKKTKNNLLQYAIQLVCILKWNKRDSFQKNPIDDNMLLFEMKQEGQKNNNLLLYAIQLVCVLKWNKRDSFQKKKKNTNLLQYAIQLVCILKWNKRGSFQKNPIDDNMHWTCVRNETRGAVFKKQQFITVCYSTCVRIEMKQEGQFSKKSNWTICCLTREGKEKKFSKNNNLLQYAIQLVCILKWNKRGSFQKTTIYYSMYAYWNSFQHHVNLCVLKWNKRDSFQKTTIYYSMLFNLCAYWNETRGVVFKKIQLMTICYWTHVRNETRGAVFKKQQFITVCYSTCVHIEMKQEGQFSKKSNWWQTRVRKETRGAVFKKQQFITVCYSTCVRIEMKQEGQFSKKKKTTIYYCMLFNLCAYWNETRGTVFKKNTQFITVCYSTCVHIEMKQEG